MLNRYEMLRKDGGDTSIIEPPGQLQPEIVPPCIETDDVRQAFWSADSTGIRELREAFHLQAAGAEGDVSRDQAAILVVGDARVFGNLTVVDPREPNHCTTKSYVDKLVEERSVFLRDRFYQHIKSKTVELLIATIGITVILNILMKFANWLTMK